MLSKLLERVSAALLFALVVVYIVIQISSALTTQIVTELAGQNTIEEKVETTGYIFRNEELIHATRAGVVHRAVAEGGRVAKQQTVATIYASDAANQVQSEITKINEQLAVLEASVVDTNYATGTVSKQDATVYSLLHEVRENVALGAYRLAASNRSALQIALNKRLLLVGEETDFSARVEELNAKKTALTSSLTEALETISAPNAGYYSGEVDGYESLFTMDALNALTVDGLDELSKSKPAALEELTIGKLIRDFTWYLACPVDRSDALGLTEGRAYTLTFPYSSDARIRATLTKKVTQTDRDTVVLVFSTNSIPTDFNFARSQTVQIVLRSYTGLQIVKSALRQVDGVEGVYVLTGGTITYKQVSRIYENEGYYLVRQNPENAPDSLPYLQLYDAVIVRGKDLYTGKVVT